MKSLTFAFLSLLSISMTHYDYCVVVRLCWNSVDKLTLLLNIGNSSVENSLCCDMFCSILRDSLWYNSYIRQWREYFCLEAIVCAMMFKCSFWYIVLFSLFYVWQSTFYWYSLWYSFWYHFICCSKLFGTLFSDVLYITQYVLLMSWLSFISDVSDTDVVLCVDTSEVHLMIPVI